MTTEPCGDLRPPRGDVPFGDPPLVERAFQYGHLLTLKNDSYAGWVSSFLIAQIQEDKRAGDLTSTCLFPDSGTSMKADIKANQDGILAGMEELGFLCDIQGIQMTSLAKDGELLSTGKIVAELTGPVGKLLETERVGLDLLGRMSGIATGTRELTGRVGKIKGAKIAATRKTLWGPLDKKGVYLGGGLTHRLGLWQSILIKENHLTALRNQGFSNPFEEAISRAIPFLEKNRAAFLEIEVENLKDSVEVGEILSNHANLPLTGTSPGGDLQLFAVLLDNFSPAGIRETIGYYHEKGWRKKILLEASGGITKENLMEYAKTGVDLISLGALTHSAKNFDFSQKIAPSVTSRK